VTVVGTVNVLTVTGAAVSPQKYPPTKPIINKTIDNTT
jgi:hypothetical protein